MNDYEKEKERRKQKALERLVQTIHDAYAVERMIGFALNATTLPAKPLMTSR